MNTNMLEHEAVRSNMATLAARGVRFVDPGAGIWPAAGSARAAWPSQRSSPPRPTRCCGQKGTLLGRCVVVTAGPTYEDIDDVRYIGNRSSGKMGYARRRGSRAARRARRARVGADATRPAGGR